MEVKFKRKYVDWYLVRLELGDHKVNEYYWTWPFHHPKSCYKFSEKKISYYALRHVYGDQVLRAYRLTGDLSCFYVMQ